MTLLGILWVAHLPLPLGALPHPPTVALLEEAPQVASGHPGMRTPADLGATSSSEPVAIAPLHALTSSTMQGLAVAVDWQRWADTAAVTVVATTALEATTSAHLDPMPKPLASEICPAAHPQHLEAKAFQFSSSAPSSAPKSPSAAKPRNAALEQAGFVIRVKGVAVGQVPSEEVADRVATDLREAMPALTQRPQDLTPTVEGDTGLGQLKDETVFALSPAALQGDDSVALTTTQWVNNLRLALGAAPLNPGQVQRVAYGLDSTSTRFQGTASWYGPYFHGRQTATGEIFDQEALTAAHKTLPFDTYLEVRNLLNGRTVVVRINDRGPYVGERSLDLSYAAARCLGSVQVGVIPYEATILTPDDPQAWEEAALPL